MWFCQNRWSCAFLVILCTFGDFSSKSAISLGAHWNHHFGTEITKSAPFFFGYLSAKTVISLQKKTVISAGAYDGRPPKSLFLSWNHPKCTESPKNAQDQRFWQDQMKRPLVCHWLVWLEKRLSLLLDAFGCSKRGTQAAWCVLCSGAEQPLAAGV